MWVGPSQAQDPACLTSVLTPVIPFSGEVPDQQSDSTTPQPAWITMIKQRQRSSQAHTPMKEPKTKNRAGAKAETKEPRHGVGPGATQKTLQKFAGASWLSLHWELCQAYSSPPLWVH